MNIAPNWKRDIFSLDILCSPRALPLHKESDIDFEKSDLYDIISDLELSELISLLEIVIYIFLFSPAFLYRWTIKSTAWVYYPLVWLTRGIYPKKEDESQQITNEDKAHCIVTESGLAILISICTTILVTFKIMFWLYPSSVTTIYDLKKNILSVIIVLNKFPLWYAANLVNAFLVIASFVYAKRYISRKSRGLKIGWSWFWFNWVPWIKRILGLYVFSCLFIWFCSEMEWLKIYIKIKGILFFPWS